MFTVGFKTDKGSVREANEDSIFVIPDRGIFIVADGVGGHRSGQLASRTTVGYIAQYVEIHPISEVRSEEELKNYFFDAFSGANSLVYTKSRDEQENRGMASTCVLCCILNNRAYVVNVGDSRAYLLRDNNIFQISEDHSVVAAMLREGTISPEEALMREDKNMITRAVGGDYDIRPDFFATDLRKGDMIILCSDGLYDEVSDNEVLRLSKSSDSMYSLASNLVACANNAGGNDNISVICVKIS